MKNTTRATRGCFRNVTAHSAAVRRAALCVALLGLTLSPVANADLTAFSRANCVNNESISWHAFAPEHLWTSSNHYYFGLWQHCLDSQGRNCVSGSNFAASLTWRAAAVHWLEGPPGATVWFVTGKHWRYDPLGRWYVWRSTSATGCNPTHI